MKILPLSEYPSVLWLCSLDDRTHLVRKNVLRTGWAQSVLTAEQLAVQINQMHCSSLNGLDEYHTTLHINITVISINMWQLSLTTIQLMKSWISYTYTSIGFENTSFILLECTKHSLHFHTSRQLAQLHNFMLNTIIVLKQLQHLRHHLHITYLLTNHTISTYDEKQGRELWKLIPTISYTGHSRNSNHGLHHTSWDLFMTWTLMMGTMQYPA